MPTIDPEALKAALPFARRFARALTGDQASGDSVVAACLRKGLPDLPGHLALHAAIAREVPEAPPSPDEPLTGIQRRLMLLTALEELSLSDAAMVLGISEEEATDGLAGARDNLKRAATTDVLIIEDEPLIAMDLRILVQQCGHRVVGLAASEDAAIQLAAQHRPGLILADINLGRGGDGMNAVRRILRTSHVPVIFITAYPQKLLTAEGLEPAFVINKPFDRLSVSIATYQAVSAGKLPIA
ncbi:response regulator [Rhodovarius crocodyli]|uniref:Response regulator n=1 Tax=Rhodovarius crocodyli TaxID=1979269 RepID=A0A437M2W1_9PROT|nr:response regulator [Rhodovarius crocodyli]RVT92028.1 response regulator [Rhodovarius crocodyli]